MLLSMDAENVEEKEKEEEILNKQSPEELQAEAEKLKNAANEFFKSKTIFTVILTYSLSVMCPLLVQKIRSRVKEK